ncbi:MAG: hypothetical protein NVV74_24785 [Magnetospirillum sp.]|nr:hypothetical protein [Magnetospirillum sp.]
MVFTNIRIEPPSDRPSPAQNALTAYTTWLDLANVGWSMLAPHRAVMAMYRMNRSLTKAMFLA